VDRFEVIGDVTSTAVGLPDVPTSDSAVDDVVTAAQSKKTYAKVSQPSQTAIAKQCLTHLC
jgi:hypothetical protein